MATKLRGSTINPDIVKSRLADLDKLLGFINADIGHMTDDQLYELISDYAYVVMPHESPTPFRDYARRHYQLVKDILSEHSSEVTNRMKRFFASIQSHLRSKVEAIVYAMESGEAIQLFECKGTQRLFYSPSTGQFTEELEPEGEKDFEKLDLALECRLAETRLGVTIRDLGFSLKAGHFGTCKRCGKFFYQSSDRERLYCSGKCAKAVAQQRYMDRGKNRKE